MNFEQWLEMKNSKRKKGDMNKVAKAYEEVKACMKCGRTDLPLQLAHKKFRSQGGKDTVENTRKWCVICHFNIDHKLKIKSFLGKKI